MEQIIGGSTQTRPFTGFLNCIRITGDGVADTVAHVKEVETDKLLFIVTLSEDTDPHYYYPRHNINEVGSGSVVATVYEKYYIAGRSLDISIFSGAGAVTGWAVVVEED